MCVETEGIGYLHHRRNLSDLNIAQRTVAVERGKPWLNPEVMGARTLNPAKTSTGQQSQSRGEANPSGLRGRRATERLIDDRGLMSGTRARLPIGSAQSTDDVVAALDPYSTPGVVNP